MKFFIFVVLVAVVSVVSCQRTYSSAKIHGKRQQPPYNHHISPPNSTRAVEEERLMTLDPAGSAGKGKVIIRLASSLSTPAPAGRRETSDNSHDGCRCELVDQCPIELMDFRFAVSCDHGTVRCCRPVDIDDAKDAHDVKPVKVVTPVTLVKRPKKTGMCKCKSRKECDHFFRPEDQLDRKDDPCPSGMVHCCETGNMGNSKDDLVKGQTPPQVQQHLGPSQFKPVQLPFLKMPHPDNKGHPQEPTVQPELAVGESIPVAPVVTELHSELWQPTTPIPYAMPPNHRQPQQQQQQQQFNPPQQFRPPVQQYQPLAPSSGLNIPPRQQYRPVPTRPYVYPPPVAQFNFNNQHQQPQQQFPQHFAPGQPGGPGGMGFSPVKRPQGGVQHQLRPATTQKPQQQPKPSSSGGFLSSLMKIFN